MVVSKFRVKNIKTISEELVIDEVIKDFQRMIKGDTSIKNLSADSLLKLLNKNFEIIYNTQEERYYARFTYMSQYIFDDSEEIIKWKLVKYHLDILKNVERLKRENRRGHFGID